MMYLLMMYSLIYSNTTVNTHDVSPNDVFPDIYSNKTVIILMMYLLMMYTLIYSNTSVNK